MSEHRPVYLDLLRIRQPLPALVSILHRISGAALFLLLPVLLHLLERSLADEQGFAGVRHSPSLRFLLWVTLTLFAYHLLAGLRFLLFDLHRPAWYRHARSSAALVLVAAAIVAVLMGNALW